MQQYSYTITADHVTDDEVAAALAAVHAYLATEAQETFQPDQESAWIHATRLSVQGLRPRRTRVAPSWHTIERLRRDQGGSTGIVGL